MDKKKTKKPTFEKKIELDTIRLSDFSEQDVKGIQGGRLRLIRHVEVLYTDTLDQAAIHETKLAFLYNFGRGEFFRLHINGYTKYS